MTDEFQIENGVLIKYLGDSAEVVIPDGVTNIAEDAFIGCEKLKFRKNSLRLKHRKRHNT